MLKPLPIRVLAVEDCASDVYLLERMLDEAGGHVRISSARRLIDAFQCIASETYDVIVLDLNLLDMDGVASVAALAAEAPMTPIIVYSGMQNRKLIQEALLSGAKDYLVKGCEDGHSLRRAIDNAIAWRSLGVPPTDRRVAL